MEPRSNSRLVSLDAFRGFTVAAMIMVNYPGSWDHVFPTLRHTEWNGLTFTDQVAPYFLFIIGVSITLSLGGRRPGIDNWQMYQRILWRSLKIFAIGMFLNAMPAFDLGNLRWTGTLHRIAVVFAISAILFLNTTVRQQAWACALLLVGYWVAMTAIPTPGETGVMLEPGRNLAAWVDRQYLPGRMWQGTWDPESLLSIIPCTATCLTGILAGHLLASGLETSEKLIRLMVGGVLSAVAGYFVGQHFPVNENLWSTSFVLVTSGFAALVLGVFFYIIDIRRVTGWAEPGVWFGMNAITAYVMGDLLALLFYSLPLGGASLNEHAVGAMTGAGMLPELASWIYALCFVGVNAIPMYILHRKKIFLKV